MFYESLIQKFLDKNFRLTVDQRSILLFDIQHQKPFSKMETTKILSTIFNDSKYNMSVILENWVETKNINHFANLLNFLNQCTVIDNRLGWKIVKDNQEINEKKLIELFKSEYLSDEIIYFYNDWYSQKICEITEKIFSEY